MKKIKTKIAKKNIILFDSEADRIYIYLLLQSNYEICGDSGYRYIPKFTNTQIAKTLKLDKETVEAHINKLKSFDFLYEQYGCYKVPQMSYDVIVSPDLIDYVNTNWTYDLQLIDFYKLIMEYWVCNKVVDTNDICQLLYPYRHGRLSCDDAALTRTAMSFLRRAGFIEYSIVSTQLQDGVCISTYQIKWVSPQPVKEGINKDKILSEATAERIVEAIHKAREQYC